MNKIFRYFRLFLGLNNITSLFIVALISAPIIFIGINIFEPVNDVWIHIYDKLLYSYISNSLIITFFALIFTVTIGVSSAWILTVFDFPGSKHFNWAMVLPLSIPGYIAAYTYSGIFDITGPIYTFIKNHTNLDPSLFIIDVMTIEGAIFIFTIVLYPYVYLTTKSFLSRQSKSLIEASRSHNNSLFQTLYRVIIPLSMPAIFAGASLVLYEVLSDYGVVKYFGIPTFSTGIFRAWLSLGDVNAAVKLSAFLMLFVFIIIFLEKLFKGKKRYDNGSAQLTPIKKIKLNRVRGWLAFTICFIPILFGFLIPLVQLLHWGYLTSFNIFEPEYFELIYNTLLLAITTAIIVTVLALVLANGSRFLSFPGYKIIIKFATLGYSIPGAIISIGIIVFAFKIDEITENMNGIVFNSEFLPYISGTIIILIFSYVVRFLTIGHGAIETGFNKIGIRYIQASQSLGVSKFRSFIKIDLPLMKFSIVSSLMLVSVDVLKELPLTLILRPFNFDTLATKTFEYANDEMIPESANAALLIILLSLILIYILNKISLKGK